MLVLKILLNLSPDADHKGVRFFEILVKKGFEFVSSKKSNTIIFNLDFILLPAETNLILEKQSCKKDELETCGIYHVKIVLALLTKVVALYIRVTII